MLIRPMLAKAMSEDGLALIDSDPNFVVGEKFDGFREILSLDEAGRVTLTSRSGADHTSNVPHLTNPVESLALTVLDGEGVGPNGRIESTKSVFGSSPAYARDYQAKNGLARFVAFDILRYKGRDLTQEPFAIRRQFLLSVVEELDNTYIVPEVLIYENKLAFFNEVSDRGGEGVMVKDLRETYHMGERSSAWLKVKRMQTWDVVVMGFTNGRGKYAGVIGAIRFGLYDSNGVLREVGKSSGMTDSLRSTFHENPESFVGKVVEVEGQEISAKGSIRFPRFIQLRPDKNPLECTLEAALIEGGKER